MLRFEIWVGELNFVVDSTEGTHMGDE